MPFIPENKYIVKYTQGNKLVYKNNTKKEYKGSYIVTNEQRYFIGNNGINVGPELILKDLNSKNNFQANAKFYPINRNKKYGLLKPNIKSKILQYKQIPVNKPKPTAKEYQRGYFMRYFAKRINGNNYLEINYKTYNSIIKKKPKYDYNLYEVGRIRWILRGINVMKYNSEAIKITSKRFPNLLTLFPVLNEYLLAEDAPMQEGLYTPGNELYFSNGDEYIGAYHVHPLQGPMVGAKHQETAHDKLYYFNQLPSYANNSYDDFLSNYDQISCFKCLTIGNQQNIVTVKASRIAGCPNGTFNSPEEASDNCGAKPNVETTQQSYSPDTSTPTPPPSTPPSSGGGTSGGGGGGY